jgi:hypothetical protein
VSNGAETLCAALAIGALTVTLWYAHAPPPTITGDVPPDHSGTAYHGIRPANAADGVLSIFDDQGGLVAGVHIRHDRVSLEQIGPTHDPDGTEHHYTTRYERDVYLWDTDFDGGVAAGYSLADTPRFETGIRWGVVRVLYGIVAVDAVAFKDAAGAGISVYPPAEYLGDLWTHIGFGSWYAAPYRGGHPGLVFGLSFSTHE